jgi:tyrosinase
MQTNLKRRSFVGGALMAGIAAGVAPRAFSQSTLKTRLDWKTFKKGRDFSSFCDAIKKMKALSAGAGPGDSRSWAYWAQVHANWCPHHDPYFMMWHRGYLAFFERQLRAVSGNPRLTLPYWDYYQDPVIPAEFTDPSPWNPLYSGRVNTNVAASMTVPAGGINPFAATVTTFQGAAGAFEQAFESRPHDPVHDLIGSTMAGMQSPLDPIFWLHHANVDRLNNAWVAAGGGRVMPPSTDPYWDGRVVDSNSRDWLGVFKYSDSAALPAKFNVAVRSTIDTRANFGYFYDNEKLPGAAGATIAAGAAGAQLGGSTVVAPRAAAQLGNFAVSGMRQTGANRLGLGGALNIVLGRQSVAADVLLSGAALRMLQSVLDSYQASPFAPLASPVDGQQYKTVKVILSDVTMTDKGAEGGYYYNLNLKLPGSQGNNGTEDNYSFGNLGPFRIAGRQHHQHTQMAVEIDIDITDLMLKRGKPNLGQYRFTLDRISGPNAPDGDVIKIGELRLELA